MKSKELFKNWKNYYINHFPCDKEDRSELEQIEKDLEVLEILKHRICLKDEKLKIDCFGYTNVSLIEASGYVSKNSEAYKLLKE